MSIITLAHVCLKTTDLQSTRKFYCDAIGLEHLFDFTRKGTVIGFYMKAGNRTFIEVFQENAIEPLGKQPIHHLCLETDDLAALRARLHAQGLKPSDLKLAVDHTWQFWITDPNGLAIEFQQYTPKSAQLTGLNVEADW